MLVNLPSPHLGAQTCLSTLKVLQAKEGDLIPFLFIVFIFGLVVESIKELGGASNPLPKFVVDLINIPLLTTFVLGATTISNLVVVMTTLGD